MRVNTRVFNERQDLFSELFVKGCPSQFEKEANNILNLVAKPGFSIGSYNTMTELDKKLMIDYWVEYDGLTAKRDGNEVTIYNFSLDWWIKKAASTENIRRARQFLVERNYLIVDEAVRERAIGAGDKFRASVRH